MMRSYLNILLISVVAGVIFSCHTNDPEPYDPRTQYTGTYNVSEYSRGLGVTTNYVIEVALSKTDDTTIVISNFYNADFNAFAVVFGNKLTLPAQTYKSLLISGYGSLNNRVLNLNYQVDHANGIIEVLDAACTKR